MKSKIIIYGIISVLLITIIAFIIMPNKSPSTDNIQLSGETKEFDMTAKQFSFEPDTINVNKGDKVKINLKTSDVTHGIAILKFGVNAVVNPGETKTIEFIASKAGTFPFQCNTYCGSGHGTMQGRLIVELK